MVGPLAAARPAAVLALAALAVLRPPGGIPQAPHPGTNSALNGVYCTSPASCWAVGFDTTGEATLNEVLHWNGTRWSLVPVPSPGGTRAMADSQLEAVRCTTPADCWAVGYYIRRDALLDQAVHWNGTKWSVAATPTPGGTLTGDFSQLLDVTCTSPRSCWAAGYYGAPGQPAATMLNQVLHWNGRRWALSPTPDPAGQSGGDRSVLASVKCGSPDSCWAVGYSGTVSGSVLLENQALHWNGTRWSARPVPSPGGTASGDASQLTGVTCTSAANCWAVGAYRSGDATLNQVLHWTAGTWTTVTVPQPDGTASGASNVLLAITCTSPRNCWAAGGLGTIDLASNAANQAVHWNGSAWTAVTVPDPGGTGTGGVNVLNAVRCANPASCWAVGYLHHPGQTGRNQILHWQHHAWSAAPAQVNRSRLQDGAAS